MSLCPDPFLNLVVDVNIQEYRSHVSFLVFVIFCRRCSTNSSLTPWSWSMCWNNCHVCHLPHGYGTGKANCSGMLFLTLIWVIISL